MTISGEPTTYSYRPSVLGATWAFKLESQAILRAMQAGAWQGAAIIAAFAALFLWQTGRYFRRNAPGRYRPDALPADLIPPA